MKNTQSLKLNRDFRRAYKGDNFVGGYTVVYMKKNIIESLIDDYTNKANVLSSGKGNVKEDKKEVKKRTKNW